MKQSRIRHHIFIAMLATMSGFVMLPACGIVVGGLVTVEWKYAISFLLIPVCLGILCGRTIPTVSTIDRLFNTFALSFISMLTSSLLFVAIDSSLSLVISIIYQVVVHILFGFLICIAASLLERSLTSMKNTFFISTLTSGISFAFIFFCIAVLSLGSYSFYQFAIILAFNIPVFLVIGYISSKLIPISTRRSVFLLFLVVFVSTFIVFFISFYILFLLDPQIDQLANSNLVVLRLIYVILFSVVAVPITFILSKLANLIFVLPKRNL